jgi:transposase
MMLWSILFLVIFVQMDMNTNHVCKAQPPQLLTSVTEVEQRSWIKIEVLRGTPPIEIYDTLHGILGNICYSRRRVLKLCQEFRNGTRLETTDRQRSGRPCTATSPEMKVRLLELMDELDGARAEDLALALDISDYSVRAMLHDEGYAFVKSRWIPHELSDEEKEQRVNTVTQHLNRHLADNTFLDRIIAIDETWLPSYMPLTDIQSRRWQQAGEPP